MSICKTIGNIFDKVFYVLIKILKPNTLCVFEKSLEVPKVNNLTIFHDDLVENVACSVHIFFSFDLVNRFVIRLCLLVQFLGKALN